LALGPISFQPAEFLKIGFLVYLATWLAGMKEKAATFKHGTLPYLCICAAVGVIMLAQPDTDTFAIMAAAGACMLFTAGGKMRHILIIGAVGVVLIAILAFQRPYLKQRLVTFIDPSRDPHGSSYQIQQSLIAIGSGGLTGRGFGQSVQKFNFLPEPMGDSIFAVASEEFGFLGAVALIILITLFIMRGLRISARAGDTFGGLLALGIVILIGAQSFLNIGAMLGIFPLSGLPLIFVSQGGTALFFALIEVGIILNISRHQRRLT
jgi:cell division protein FtsW